MKALIIVDIQNDFIPGGALPVPDGHMVIPIVNELQPRFDVIVATQDWHPPHHRSFAVHHPGSRPGDLIELNGLKQVLWPAHCVQNTAGAALVPGLETSRIAETFQKGTDPQIDSYSGFFDNGRRKATGLGDFLTARKVREVYVVGLATDYCVKFTALDAMALGFKTHVIEDACRGVDLQPGDVARALEELKAAGVTLMNSDELSWPTMKYPSPPAEQWRGKFLRVLKCGRWEYADRVGCAGAVAIVAVTQDNRLILTEQFRIPVNQRVVELPAGLSGDVRGQSCEAAIEAAKRELLEETGYEARQFALLTSGPPSAGLASEIVDFFGATGLRRVSAGGGDGHEDIQVHEVPLNQIDDWLHQKLADGVLVDPKVYAGLYLLSRSSASGRAASLAEGDQK